MVGVVVAAHGRLAEELIRTAEGVVGPLPQTRALACGPGAGDLRARLREAIAAIDQGGGVLLLTDLLGGSPTNLCLSVLAEREVEVVTGVNLAMLLKLASLRTEGVSAAELAHQLAEAGQRAIVEASGLLRGRVK